DVTDDTLTVSSDGTKVIINDPNHLIATSISGATGNGSNTVTVPYTAIGAAAQIQVNTGNGNDSLTVSHAAGRFLRNLTYTAGAQTGGPGDRLTVTGGTFATLTHNLTGAAAGSLV